MPVAGLAFLAVLFGGGGAEGPVNNGLLHAAGGLLLVVLIASHFDGSRPLPKVAQGAAWLLGSLLLIVLLQLVPLPPSIWHGLPGHDVAHASLSLIGAENHWRPLTLDAEATRRFAAALLLPAGLIFGMMGATRRESLLAVQAIVVAAAISATIGALQLALGHPDWLSYYEGSNLGSASGVYANANHQAALLLAAILFLGLAIRADRRRSDEGRGSRWSAFHLGWVALPFFVVVTLAAGSRAGMALLLVAVPGALFVGLGRRSPMIWLGAIAAVVLALAATIMFSPGSNALPVGQSFVFGDDRRYSFLPDVLYTLRHYWLWGSGFGTFVPVFGLNENLDIAGAGFINHAHNDLLEWLIEGGLLAGLWLAALAALILWRVARTLKDRQRLSGSHVGAVIAGALILVVLGLHSLLDYPLRAAGVSAAAAVATGLIFGGLRDSPPSPVSRQRPRWPLVVAAVGGLLIGAQVVRIYVAQGAVRDHNGLMAAAVRPQNGSGLALAAEVHLEGGDSAAARRLAAAGLERSPLSVRALRVMALALPMSPQSMNVWRTASAMGWRDGPTQFWALQQALANGEYEVAAVRADAFMRTQDLKKKEYLSYIRSTAADPRFRTAMLQRFALEPDWRQTFFTVPVDASDREVESTYAMLQALQQTSHKPTLQEARATISALLARQAYGPASELYGLVRGRRASSGELIDDGGFARSAEEYRRETTPFDWTLVPIRGVTVAIEDRDGRPLLIDTDGNTRAKPVRRYVALAPGAYRLEYSVAGDADSPEALGIGIYCGKRQAASSSVESLRGSGFERRALNFNVPANCPMILLAFEAKAIGHPASARFDNVSLRRI